MSGTQIDPNLAAMAGGLMPGMVPPPYTPTPVASAPLPQLPAGLPIPGMAPAAAPVAAPASSNPAYWQSYRPNIFSFESGNGAQVGNGGGAGQFIPSMRAAFIAQNPQYATANFNSAPVQNAAFDWMGHQIDGALGKTGQQPGVFYAAYALGPTAAKALAAADPNAPAADVIGKLKDGSALIKGNPELFTGGATAADALLRAQTIQTTGRLGQGAQAPGGAPGVPTAATPGAPPPVIQQLQSGQPGSFSPLGGMLSGILGDLPKSPGLQSFSGPAFNPALSIASKIGSQAPAGSIGSIVGDIAGGLQSNGLNKQLLNNQVSLQNFNGAMDRAKVGAQLAEMGLPKPLGFMPQQQGTWPDGTPKFVQPFYSPTGGVTTAVLPPGTLPGQVAEAAARGQAAAQAQASVSGIKAVNGALGKQNATLFTGDQTAGAKAAEEIPILNSLKQAIPTNPNVFNQGDFKTRLVHTLGQAGFLPPSAYDQTTGTLVPQIMKQMTTGDIGELKEEGGFRFMAGPELKMISGAVAGTQLTYQGAQMATEALNRAALREQKLAQLEQTSGMQSLQDKNPALFQAWRNQQITAMLQGKYGPAFEEINQFNGKDMASPPISGGPAQPSGQPAAPAASPAPAQQAAPAASSGPKVGDIEGGYVFKGGNPADPSSWSKQ